MASAADWKTLSFGIGTDKIKEKVKLMLADEEFMQSKESSYHDNWNKTFIDHKEDDLWMTLMFWTEFRGNTLDGLRLQTWFLKALWDNYKRTNPTEMPEGMFTRDIISPDNIVYITGDDLGLAQEREIGPEQKEVLLEYLRTCKVICDSCRGSGFSKYEYADRVYKLTKARMDIINEGGLSMDEAWIQHYLHDAPSPTDRKIVKIILIIVAIFLTGLWVFSNYFL